jgi:hypothetical protein
MRLIRIGDCITPATIDVPEMINIQIAHVQSEDERHGVGGGIEANEILHGHVFIVRLDMLLLVSVFGANRDWHWFNKRTLHSDKEANE